jgi:autotransporter-associated beta strand protein
MSSNSLGSRQILPAGTAVTLGTAATLDLGGMSQNIGSLAGASGSAVLLGLGTNASALTFGNASNTTFAGTISGSGAVIKNGAGAVTLSGVNTYSKATVINAGTVGFGAGNNSNAVASLQPLLWLSFDQVGGSVITNRGTGGSALNGTLVGANVSIVPGGRNGNALKAGSGSYSSSYVLVNNPGTLFNGATPGSSWTVALWVKTSASGGAFLYQGSGSWSSGNTSFFLTSATQASSGSTYAGGRVGGVRYGGGWMGGNINVNDNNWHFLTITDNGGAKTIYVDGNADTNYTASQLWNTAAAGTELWIGGTADTGDGNAAFNGLIDEFFVFNRALNQNEILNLMAPVTNTAGQLPAATPVSLAAAATLDLSGISQTIASLSDIGGGGGLVTNSAGAGAVLVLSNNLAGAATFSGQINDAGVNPVSLVKSGSYTQVLAGASGCSGPAVVSGGSLMVNGALGAGSVSVAGGTLGGTGILSGPVTVQSGGTLSPGYAGIGTLTISNSLTLGGTNLMEINKSLQTNDLVAASGAVTFGGTLTVTNLAGTLAAGDSFMLFQAAACNSSFAVWNLPALGTGLAWNTNSLTNGVLAVIATLAPQFGSILQTGDGNYQFTGAGSAGVTYELDAATNLAPPIAWSFVTNTVADQSGQFELLDLQATNFTQRFYRIASSP